MVNTDRAGRRFGFYPFHFLTEAKDHDIMLFNSGHIVRADLAKQGEIINIDY